MRKLLFIVALLVVFNTNAQVKLQNVLIENRTNPVGLDTKQPRFSWQLVSDKKNVMQTAYEVKVTDEKKKQVWTSGKVNSDQSVFVPYGGPALVSNTKYTVQVKVWDSNNKASNTSEGWWQTALFDRSDWKAKWIMSPSPEDSVDQPSPIFRKEFTSTKKVASATAFATAQGVYDLVFNKQRMDVYLAPGWTSYNQRLQYQQYDVTNLMVNGPNVIGIVAANGWYRGNIGFQGQHNYYGKDLAVFFQLIIKYTDGTSEVIVSDESWKTATGSVRRAEIYHGETIDKRKAQEGFDKPGFDDSKWMAVKIKPNNDVNLVATYNEPIKAHETFKPVKIFKTPKGDNVIDFGQNLVGWVRVKATGKSGDKITIYHSEVLDKEGNFYVENLRAAKQMNEYILSGNGEETFMPTFTFQGFRYVLVEGYPGELKAENFTATALYSDMKPTGTFTSSNQLINQLQHNIQWGQRGNFLDVPTDCPQRDERLGWTGDAQAFARTASFNFGVNDFFAKWLKDVALDQVNGSVPFVVPNVLGPNAAGSAGWADAATIIPWTMYTAYGDKRILEDQHESMKNWVGYMERNSTNYLWNKGFHFGDWLFYRPFDDNDGRSAVTDKYLIAQCFFANSVDIVVKSATVLGKQDDVAKYSALLKNVKDAFVKEYVTPNGRLVSGTQTAFVLALNFDMLPEAMRKPTVDRLVNNIKSYDNHLTTGFLGTPYLCHVLSRFGHSDVAYTLLLQETYPSWLYPVKMGATTIWERWDGIRPDSTFQTPGMNSFNHYAYGAIGDWMYRVVAGIDTKPDMPGYKGIVIKPVIDGRLNSASAEYLTYYGKVKSSWKLADGKIQLDVEIPANTKATIHVPGGDTVEVGSGTYSFSAPFIQGS
jgi:alpha-L-rhamnosidase